MKKPFLSMTLLVALALLLLSATASRGSEGRSRLEPFCSVEDGCQPQECGIRNCGMIDRGCGLGTMSCGECDESQSCDDGVCRWSGGGHQCPCGGSWPNACEACPDLSQPPVDAAPPSPSGFAIFELRPTTTAEPPAPPHGATEIRFPGGMK